MSTQLFNYNGTKITFATSESGEVMVNATEMANPFKKQSVHWLNNQQTKDYLGDLAKLRNLSLEKLVATVRGGNTPGTWMHEDVAMEFARWLNPRFAIWCNDRIKELAKHGFTATPAALEQMMNNPDFIIGMASKLKEERRQKELAQNQLYFANKTIVEQSPKVKYHDKVLQSVNTYTTTQIAKELGLSGQALNRLLYQKSIQFKQSGVWMLYSKFQGLKYTKTRTYTFVRSDSSTGSKTETVWTEKGREFIHNKIKGEAAFNTKR